MYGITDLGPLWDPENDFFKKKLVLAVLIEPEMGLPGHHFLEIK